MQRWARRPAPGIEHWSAPLTRRPAANQLMLSLARPPRRWPALLGRNGLKSNSDCSLSIFPLRAGSVLKKALPARGTPRLSGRIKLPVSDVLVSVCRTSRPAVCILNTIRSIMPIDRGQAHAAVGMAKKMNGSAKGAAWKWLVCLSVPPPLPPLPPFNPLHTTPGEGRVPLFIYGHPPSPATRPAHSIPLQT